ANGLGLDAIRGAIPISGVYDFSLKATGDDKDQDKIKEAMRGMFTDDGENRKDASPILHIHKGVPPMMIIVAKKDPGSIREQTAAFKKALEDAGEKPEYVFLKNEGHVSEIMRIGKFNDPISEHVLRFIKTH
ncbi:MAG: prolyl oligopeptidase family serine peptidase, partial [bacterium]